MYGLWLYVKLKYILRLFQDQQVSLSGEVVVLLLVGLSFVFISGCFILDGIERCISILQRLRV